MTALADVLFVVLVCAAAGLPLGAFTPHPAAQVGQPTAQWYPDTDEDEVPPPKQREDD